MKDDGRQDGDQFATTGQQGSRRALGTRRRVGARWVRRGATFAKMACEVHPTWDAAVNDQGRLVRIGRAAQQNDGPQALVACGQVERERDGLRHGWVGRRRFFPRRLRRRCSVRRWRCIPRCCWMSLSNSSEVRQGDSARRAWTKANTSSVHLLAALGPRLLGNKPGRPRSLNAWASTYSNWRLTPKERATSIAACPLTRKRRTIS